MKSALRKAIIPLCLIVVLGLSACASREQIRAELESEEGRALMKEAIQEEMKTMMMSKEHKKMMMKMMMKMKKNMDN